MSKEKSEERVRMGHKNDKAKEQRDNRDDVNTTERFETNNRSDLRKK